jgi:hypothetical protein
METETQNAAGLISKRITNLNWYVFGFVLLFVGMTFITGHPAWMVVALLATYVFGWTNAIKLADNVMNKNG